MIKTKIYKYVPAKNFRFFDRRCCANCDLFISTGWDELDGEYCKRESGFDKDPRDEQQFFMVCDGWKRIT